MATTKNPMTDKTVRSKSAPPAMAAPPEAETREATNAPEARDAEAAWKGLPADSQLISFGDRFTFTFAQGREVGSIHFDRSRGEIFYKGHNIRNMDMEEWQMQILEGLRQTLHHDEQGKAFAADYARTLDKVTLEKRNDKRGPAAPGA